MVTRRRPSIGPLLALLVASAATAACGQILGLDSREAIYRAALLRFRPLPTRATRTRERPMAR